MQSVVKWVAIVLAALMVVPGAANAAVFDIAIFADVSGTNTRAACGPGQTFPFCPVETLPFEQSLSAYLGPIDLMPGENPFSYGGYYTTGLFTGVITNANGLLTGHDLLYTYAGCSGPCAGDHIVASAPTFRVTGGLTGAVPEPGTWATLLIGLGAVGWAMRRRGGPLLLPENRHRAPA